MSFELTTCEKIEINVTDRSAPLVLAARTYLNQFIKFDGIVGDVTVIRVKATIDGTVFYVNICDTNDELFDRLNDAGSLVIDSYFSIEQELGVEYGYTYWSHYLNNDTATLTDVASYKCIEYGADYMCAYRFDNAYIGEVEYGDDAQVVSKIYEWYSPNFGITATCDSDIDGESLARIVDKTEEISFTYDMYEWLDFPYKNELSAFSSFRILFPHIPNLVCDLQQLVDILLSIGAEIELNADLIPDHTDTNDFSLIKLTLEGERVVAKYCSF